MNTFLILGAVILFIVVVTAVAMAVKETKSQKSAIEVWEIASRSLSNPLKMFALASSLLLLIASLSLSAALAETLHLRMQEHNMVDISYFMLLVIQVVGTIGAYLAPLFLIMMWDDTLVRPTFDSKEADKIDLRKFYITVAGMIGAIITAVWVGAYLGYVSSAAVMSGSFFVITVGVSAICIVYCYIKRGSNYEEIFAFATSIFVASAVYALDFHWNELLTYSLPISKLDPMMDEMLFAERVNAASIDFSNRTFATLVMIIIDIFASAIGLVTGDLKGLYFALRFTNDQNLNNALIAVQNGSNNTPPPTTTTPPTPPVTPPNTQVPPMTIIP